MTDITIESFVNGFSVKWYDPKDGFVLKEFHEEYIDVLRALEHVVNARIVEELGRKLNSVGI